MRPSTSKEGPPTQPQLPSIFSGSPLPNWPAPIPAGTLAPPQALEMKPGHLQPVSFFFGGSGMSLGNVGS